MNEKNDTRDRPSIGPASASDFEGGNGQKIMRPDDVNQLRSIVIDCAKEVFATCHIELSLKERPELDKLPSSSLAAFIGFAGAQLRGSLTVVAPFSLMRTAYPLLLKNEPEAGLDVIDWAGELANQLLGRIENRLAGRRIELLAGTPKVLLGEHLSVPRPPRNSVCDLRFDSVGGEELCIWFDASVREDIDLFGRQSADNPCAAEGDLVLF
jgi:chemotaxis protein CheX